MAENISQLENLITWVNTFCDTRNVQPFGVHKTLEGDGGEKYVAFVLEAEVLPEPDRYYTYNLLGFLSSPCGEPISVYRAIIEQIISGGSFPPFGNAILIEDQRVLIEEMKGIGSAAMTATKHLAALLHCNEIAANRVPDRDAEDGEERLWNFYEKNGFRQKREDPESIYDMRKYVACPVQKEEY